MQPKELTVPPEQHVQKFLEAIYKELDGKMNGNFGMCKNGCSGPEYNHLDRE